MWSSEGAIGDRLVMGNVRDTHVSRGAIKDSVRLAIWARSTGRCTICNRRLLGDARTFLHSVTAAELAHNVGATGSDTSPRAQDAGVSGSCPFDDV
jgi:hypothetical protein